MIGRRSALALALAVALGLPASAAAEPYEVDAILPLTGGGAFLGRGGVAMLGVIETVVNRSGGIQGRPLKFVVHDDATSPQQAVQIVGDLIAKKTTVVIGPELVSTCGAVEPLLHDGPVVYCVSAGIHPQEGSYMFSCGASTFDVISAAVRYLRERGFRRIASLTSTDATGQDGDRNIDTIFARPENGDTQIVAREHFNVTDLSVDAQLSRIRSSGAQALIAWTTGTPFGTVMRGMSTLGLDLPTVGGQGNLTREQMKAYASIMPRDVEFPAQPSLVPDTLPNGAIKRAALQLQAAFKAAGVQPDAATVQGWDAAMLLIDALRRLGPSATAAQARDFIAGSRFAGVNGTYDFKGHPQRGLGIDATVMVRWDAGRNDWVAVSQLGGAFPR